MIPVEYGVRFRILTDSSAGTALYGMLLPGQGGYHGGERLIRQNGVERIAEESGLAFRWGSRYHPGANSFAWIYPWSEMVRVNLAIDGSEMAAEGDADFAIDGTNGDVMVRLPLYYYATEIDDAAGTVTLWVCQYKLTDAYAPDPMHLRPDGTINRGWEYIGAFFSRWASGYNQNTLTASSFTPLSSSTANISKLARYIQACSKRKGEGWRAFDWRAWAYLWRLNVVQNARLDHFGGHALNSIQTDSNYAFQDDSATYRSAAEHVLSPRADRAIRNGNDFGHLGGQMVWQNITALFSNATSPELLISGLWSHNGSYYLEMDPSTYVEAWPADCLTPDVPENFTRIGDAPANDITPANLDWTGEMSPLVLPRGAGGLTGRFLRGTTDSRWYGASRYSTAPLGLRLDLSDQNILSFLIYSPLTLDGPGTPSGAEITLHGRTPAKGETITSDQAITYVLGATPEPRLYDESNANALIYSGTTDSWGPGYSGSRAMDDEGHIALTVRRDQGWLTGRCSIWIQADDE